METAISESVCSRGVNCSIIQMRVQQVHVDLEERRDRGKDELTEFPNKAGRRSLRVTQFVTDATTEAKPA